MDMLPSNVDDPLFAAAADEPPTSASWLEYALGPMDSDVGAEAAPWLVAFVQALQHLVF
jgi:hypothetical protein